MSTPAGSLSRMQRPRRRVLCGRVRPPRPGALSARRSPARAGFTLIEVLLATALVAVGLGAVTAAVSMSLRMAGGTSGLMGAMHVAREQMEQVATHRFTDAALGEGTHVVELPGYDLRYVVSPAGAGRKDVQVVASYFNPARGGTSRVEMVTRLVDALQY